MSAPLLICFAVPEEAAPFRRTAPSGVEILVTGMGKANAERSVLSQLAKSTPPLVLTCGFAGGLNPDLAANAVVFSEDDGAGLAADLRAAGAVSATFHCASRVAVTAAEKLALRKSTGADVVEMESEIIRNLCRQKQIPSATIRVISDTASEDLPLDFNALMTGEQELSYAKLAMKLATAPGKIPELMKFQKRVQSAAERLGAVLTQLLRRRVGGG